MISEGIYLSQGRTQDCAVLEAGCVQDQTFSEVSNVFIGSFFSSFVLANVESHNGSCRNLHLHGVALPVFDPQGLYVSEMSRMYEVGTDM